MNAKPLEGKVGLVFGVANKRSIAWAIAQAWAEAGAKLIFNYQGERLKDNVEELASTFGADTPLFPCDVSKDEEVDAFFDKVAGITPRVDLLLHSIAYAPKEALEGDFINTTREAYSTAHNISAYSLVHLARKTAPLMTDGGSIMTLTYLGAERAFPKISSCGIFCTAKSRTSTPFPTSRTIRKLQSRPERASARSCSSH